MDAVCFDMDGVIVDSERHWIPLENERILPRAVPSGEVLASEITGMNVTHLYAYLSEQYGTAMSEEEFVGLYDEVAEELYRERVTLIDGFEGFLRMFRGRGNQVALVSSSPHRWIEIVLDQFGLRSAFDVIVSGEDIEGEAKPAPDIYLYTASELGVPPEQCVAVEDSAHGVRAAIGAKMVCVGYRTDINADQELSEATAVVEGPDALWGYLKAHC